MQTETAVPQEELIDTLIAVSVMAKRLAVKLAKKSNEGEDEHEQDERTGADA